MYRFTNFRVLQFNEDMAPFLLKKTYIRQLCVDTAYCIKYLPGAMTARDKWRERVKELFF